MTSVELDNYWSSPTDKPIKPTPISVVIILTLVYEATLWIIYEHFIAPVYSYTFVTYSTPPQAFVIGGLALAVVCAVAIPTRISRPSHIVLWILFLTVVAPCMTIMYFMLSTIQIDALRVLEYQLDLASCFVALCLCYRGSDPKVRNIPLDEATFWTITFAMGGLLLVLLIARTGLHFRLPSLYSVYSVRSQFAASAGYVAGYAVSWLSNVISPFFIVYGGITKKWLLMAIGVAGELVAYDVAGFKSALYSTLILLAFYVLLKGNRKLKIGRNLLLFSILLMIAAAILDTLLHRTYLTTLFTQRMLVTPANLTALYVGFFSHNPFALYPHLTSHFISPRFSMNPPQLIGNYYWPGIGADPNVNLWADSFSEFGFLGLPATTAVLAYILRYFDGAMRRHDLRFSTLLLVIPATSLASTALPTSIGTHGIGLIIVIAAVLPKTIIPVENTLDIGTRSLNPVGVVIYPRDKAKPLD